MTKSKKSMSSRPPEDQEGSDIGATAYHEAGHAFVALFLREQFETVTIIRSEIASDALAGCCIRSPSLERKIETREQTETEIQILLAGELAEGYFLGGRAQRHSHEHDVHELALGANRQNPQQASAFVHWLRLRTEELLNRNWDLVAALASALMEFRTLPWSRVVELTSLATANRGSSRPRGQ
jgi:ATP-dependent Zn protease